MPGEELGVPEDGQGRPQAEGEQRSKSRELALQLPEGKT